MGRYGYGYGYGYHGALPYTETTGKYDTYMKAKSEDVPTDSQEFYKSHYAGYRGYAPWHGDHRYYGYHGYHGYGHPYGPYGYYGALRKSRRLAASRNFRRRASRLYQPYSRREESRLRSFALSDRNTKQKTSRHVEHRHRQYHHFLSCCGLLPRFS